MSSSRTDSNDDIIINIYTVPVFVVSHVQAVPLFSCLIFPCCMLAALNIRCPCISAASSVACPHDISIWFLIKQEVLRCVLLFQYVALFEIAIH
jgi:hypothetical protein